MEKIKEKKALKTARLEKAIENELLERLKQVSDGEIYNYPEVNYNKVLNQASKNYQKGITFELYDTV
jgi:protein MAK16